MTHKILIIGPSWVGDTMMAQCLFKLLKQRNPAVMIDVLAPAWTFSLLQRMPEVASAIPMLITHGELKLRERYQLALTLRDKQYDQAIVLPNSFKSALIPWWAKIPKRTGWLGECRLLALNDVRYRKKKHYPLMIEQYMALGVSRGEPLPAKYPYPELFVSAEAQAATLAKHQPIWRGQPVLALCPGAAYGTAKCWPAEYYAHVANKKMKEGWDIWLFGSEKDRAIADKIMAFTANRCENLVGRIDLAETIDLLSLVSGVVANDSGLLHVACALHKPLIALYGPTTPAFTPPLSPTAKVFQLTLPCQPCFKRECPLQHHRCMRDLSPTGVLATILEWKI